MDAKRVWDFLGADPMTILEREPLRRLAAAGELVAFEHPGFWQPMDTFREYTMLNDLWTRGVAPWKTW
jgi:glucose-1-phosphate cytidylyltransferase